MFILMLPVSTNIMAISWQEKLNNVVMYDFEQFLQFTGE